MLIYVCERHKIEITCCLHRKINDKKRVRSMRKKRDKFACVNGEKSRGNMIVLAIAVLAICISGALCARKLQMDQKYISQYEDHSIHTEALA